MEIYQQSNKKRLAFRIQATWKNKIQKNKYRKIA